MWFVLGFMIIAAVTALFFRGTVRFKDMSLFTFIWTFTAVLIVFTALNFKRLRLLKQNLPQISIINIYIFFLYQMLPYLLIAVIYKGLAVFSGAFKNYFNNMDLFLFKTDMLIFGINPAVWFEGCYNPWAVEYFMIAYGLYLVYPYFYLIYLFQRNQLTVLHRAILAQILALAVSFVCFIVFPAYGPRFAANPEHPLSIPEIQQFRKNIEGVKSVALKNFTERDSLYSLQFDGWNALERVKTDCVPSMHVCLCLISFFYAMRYRNIFRWKKFSIFIWIIGVSSLVFCTVFLRYHWITDVAAGAVLSIISYFTSEKIYSVWLKYRFRNDLPEPEIGLLEEADKLRKC